MIAPAELLQSVLLSKGLVTPAESLQPWCCFVGFMPDGPPVPHDAVAVYNTSPMVFGRQMEDGHNVQTWGVQVKVRSLAYSDGWSVACSIYAALQEVKKQSATQADGSIAIVSNVSMQSGVLALGTETQGGTTMRRSYFSINCLLTIQLQ